MKTFARVVTLFPRTVLALILLLTAGLGLGLPRLQTQNNQDSELPEDDPIVRTNDRLKEVFGDKAVVLLGVEADDVLQPATLEKVARLTEALQEVDGVIEDEVVSLTTLSIIKGRDWGLEVGPFLEDLPTTEAEVARLRADVRSNELVYGQLVSRDETLTLIRAHVGAGYDQETVHRQVYALAERFQGPERIYVAGDAIQPQEIDLGIQQDVSVLLPVVLLLILVGFYLSFRTLRGVLLPFAVCALSIVWTMGLMGHLGFPVTVVSSALPILMVAVASSYGIHVVHRYYETVLGRDRREGARLAAEKMGPAILMTGLTSALGSATLIIFRVTSIREFGIITALGMLSALVLTLTVIPACLALLKEQPRRERDRRPGRLDALLTGLARFALYRRKLVLALSALVLLLSGLGISQIRVGNDFVAYFPRDHRLRTTFEVLNDRLGGARYIDVMIEGSDEEAVKDPALLRQIQAFQRYAEGFEEVGRTFSFADVIRRIHRVMHDDDPAYDRIPEERELVAQYLLLYSMSGDPGDFGDLVDYDFRRAKIRVMLTTSDQDDHLRLYSAFQGYFDAHFDEGVRADFGGDVMFWLAQIRYIVLGKLHNIVLALAVVLLFCILVFRSFAAGLLSIVPLTVSTLLTFGIMGFLGIRLETGTAIITAIAVGIGVDFALHFLSRFREEYGKTDDLEAATAVTMLTAGKAITFDVFSNVLGFAVFAFSGFLPIRYFGWLVSLTMVTVGLATFVLLPTLIAAFRPRFILGRKDAAPAVFETNGALPVMEKAKMNAGLAALLLVLAAPGATALAQDLSAREIIAQNDRQQRADDEQVAFEMKLINDKGKERSRRVTRVLKTDADGARKTLIRFLAPSDVRGTGLLAIENDDRDDDQWLYLPALRRARRISPSDQTDSFMGSDFTYEDIGSEDMEHFDYTLMRTEMLGDARCYVVGAVPRTEDKRAESGYGRREIWIDAANFVIRKTLFYDEKGRAAKLFNASNVRRVAGTDKWRAHRMEMLNLKTDHRTVLLYDAFEIDAGLTDELFSMRYLERGV